MRQAGRTFQQRWEGQDQFQLQGQDSLEEELNWEENTLLVPSWRGWPETLLPLEFPELVLRASPGVLCFTDNQRVAFSGLFLVIYIFVVLGLELRASQCQARALPLNNTHSPIFFNNISIVMSTFEIQRASYQHLDLFSVDIVGRMTLLLISWFLLIIVFTYPL